MHVASYVHEDRQQAEQQTDRQTDRQTGKQVYVDNQMLGQRNYRYVALFSGF